MHKHIILCFHSVLKKIRIFAYITDKGTVVSNLPQTTKTENGNSRLQVYVFMVQNATFFFSGPLRNVMRK